MKIVKFFVVVLQLFEIVYLRRILRAKRQVNEDFLKEIFLQVANNLTNNFETKGVDVICLRGNMCIAISSKFYELQDAAPVDWESIGLDQPCANAVVSDMLPDARTLCTTEGFMTCGTEMSLNDSHVTFKNKVRTRKTKDTNYPNVLIGPYNNHEVPWECSYPLDYLVSLSSKKYDSNFYFYPLTSEIRQIVMDAEAFGTGTFDVGMFLYSSDLFETTIAQPPTLSLNATIYAGVSLLKGPFDAVIEVKTCWATPSPDRNDAKRFTLIGDYCPNYEFVKIYGNVISRHFHWSSSVFRFKNSSSVYLHCEVEICFYQHQKCNKREDCSFFPAFRKKRSLTLIKEDKTLTVGPLNLNDDVRLVDHVLSGTIEEERFEEVDENNKIKYQDNLGWRVILMLFLVSGTAAILIFAIITYRNFARTRCQRK